jgi:inorganic pyrophosphatase
MRKKRSCTLQQIIGKNVQVIVDRPLGSYHPEHTELYYSVNYGYVQDIIAGDGDYQDAYILGVDYAIKVFTGYVIAIIHRYNDNEDKWVVAQEKNQFSKEEIIKKIEFQEKYFMFDVIM